MGIDFVLVNDVRSVLYFYFVKKDVIFFLIKYMYIVIFCYFWLKNIERVE